MKWFIEALKKHAVFSVVLKEKSFGVFILFFA
jgi:hypothetical protein